MNKAISFSLRVFLCTLGLAIATQDFAAAQEDKADKLRLKFQGNKLLLAQITTDGTVNTQVNQNGNTAEITGGETRGSNLFHSFQDFSVITDNEAFFNNADSISNIFSRVTGGNISNIDGVIRANGSASLFLINPAGIIFGENARLDIGGSFYGSSASSVLFEDGEFSAIDNLDQPILTINAPIGLGFRDNPGSIALQGSNLAVVPGQSLSLLGGEININNGTLTALGGNINLGGLSATGEVFLSDQLGFDFSNVSSLANVSLSNGGQISVNGNGGGNIAVDARNLTLSDASSFNAGINSESSTPSTQAGNIRLEIAETLTLNSISAIRNNVSNISSGNSGNIEINANNLSVNDQATIATLSLGNGNTGDILLDIEESITLNQTAEFKSQTLSDAVGNAGNINIQYLRQMRSQNLG